MSKYYKIARPDGWDFKTGETINYRDSIGKRVEAPEYKKGGGCCTKHVLHASKDLLDALHYAKLPCSVFIVSGRPVASESDKAGFKGFTVLEEIPEPELTKLFGFDYDRLVYPIDPLGIDNEVTDEDIRNLEEWVSVSDPPWRFARESVWSSTRGSVRNSLWRSTWASVEDSVQDSLWNSRWTTVWKSSWPRVVDSVWPLTMSSGKRTVSNFMWDSVMDSVSAYIGSCFPGITDWEHITHEPGVYPFQSAVNLWERGFIPVYDNDKWSLWKQNGGIVYTLEGDVE